MSPLLNWFKGGPVLRLMSSPFVSCVMFAFLALSGCAYNVTANSITANLDVVKSDSRQEAKLANQLTLILESNYERTIDKDSRWIKVGSIAQGDVYKRAENIFTIEGSNVHEAYLVVTKNRLVGFYLPFEKVFVKSAQTPLIFRE